MKNTIIATAVTSSFLTALICTLINMQAPKSLTNDEIQDVIYLSKILSVKKVDRFTKTELLNAKLDSLRAE